MNKFKKYCPNVWLAECEQEHEKGDIIQIENKYGKENDYEVYNLIEKNNDKYFYSIVKVEEKTYAERKAEKYNNAVKNNENKLNEKINIAQEGRGFLSLAEPVKIGHHSENKHKAIIEKTEKNMDKAIEYCDKIEEQKQKAKYWEYKAKEITLANPDCLEFFEFKLEEAIEYQNGLKNGTIPKEHAYSLTYASKDVKDLKQKVEIAKLLWE